MADKIPVFLINGFLEAGKTEFIKFTMEQGILSLSKASLPARGAWIEIYLLTNRSLDSFVAPREGSVD